MRTRTIRGEVVDMTCDAAMGAEFIDPTERNLNSYEAFLASKAVVPIATGLTTITPLHSAMFQFQKDVTHWSLKLGKSAAFLGTGTGKTLIELEWAKHISKHTDSPILILAPLAVAQQTVYTEAPKFGFDARIVKHRNEVGGGINVTNYDRIDDFDPSVLSGVVCDESSILKSLDSKTRAKLIEMFAATQFKLCVLLRPHRTIHGVRQPFGIPWRNEGHGNAFHVLHTRRRRNTEMATQGTR